MSGIAMRQAQTGALQRQGVGNDDRRREKGSKKAMQVLDAMREITMIQIRMMIE